MLFVLGLLFFGCGCGGWTVPLRRITIGGWMLVSLGLLLMALALAWGFIYQSPWLGWLSLAASVVALALVTVGLWTSQRRTEK
jgi:hypothetical protein